MLSFLYIPTLTSIHNYWKKPLKVGGEGDDRGWKDWMALPTQWVWVNSRSWWWTGRPDVLQAMGSRVGHDWATELNCAELTTIALTRQTLVSKVMSLLFHMLSRLVIAFLSRSIHLLISWVQSPSAVILEPPKINSLTVCIVSHLFGMKWWHRVPWS